MAEAVKLNKDIFGLEVKNHELVARAYKAYLAAARTAHPQSKTRGLVRGGGRKPWQQKGTGRARIGSIRAPHWRGGGVTFGPSGEQNYLIGIPKTAKRIAIRQSLSMQNADKAISTIAQIKLKASKTKEAAAWLETQKLESGKNLLLVVENMDEQLSRAFNNIPKTKIVSANYLNVYDIINADKIMIENGAIKVIDKWLGEKKSVKPKVKDAAKKVAVKKEVKK